MLSERGCISLVKKEKGLNHTIMALLKVGCRTDLDSRNRVRLRGTQIEAKDN
jgi:hypothetical protein